VTTTTTTTTSSPALSPSDRGRLVADVSRAGSIVAPYWPLTTFVAVNPLGGLTDLSFDDATAAARDWFGARTHLPLQAYRAEYARGTVTDTDLDRAILRHDPTLAQRRPLDVGGVRVHLAEIVRWDLLHGPVGDPLPPRPVGAVADALDQIMTAWCAAFVDEAHTPWQMPDRDRGFYRSWLAVAPSDRRLAAVIGREARTRIAALPDEPAELLDLALGARGVSEDGRVDALRTWILRTPGWAGFARWCDEWAPADRAGVRLRMLDLAAVRAAMDHLAPDHLDLSRPTASSSPETSLESRVNAAVAAFGGDDHRGAITEVLGAITEHDRTAIWLAAHEWNLRDRLLSRLTGSDASGSTSRPTGRPDAQVVFCIDVRSEGFRRELEGLGNLRDVRVRRVLRRTGSLASARVPRGPGQLSGARVTPQHEIVEVAVDGDSVVSLGLLGDSRASTTRSTRRRVASPHRSRWPSRQVGSPDPPQHCPHPRPARMRRSSRNDHGGGRRRSWGPPGRAPPAHGADGRRSSPVRRPAHRALARGTHAVRRGDRVDDRVCRLRADRGAVPATAALTVEQPARVVARLRGVRRRPRWGQCPHRLRRSSTTSTCAPNWPGRGGIDHPRRHLVRRRGTRHHRRPP
jgi:hypothetical protein